MNPKHTLDITVTDLFCGAGGSTTGAIQAGAQVRLAVNHWPRAIETHHTNYPQITHVLTDISQTDPRRYPSTTMLLASPECTNHSLSKGHKRRGLAQPPLAGFGEKGYDPSEERSRATMWDALRFAEVHDYQIIILENVVDARLWVMWDAWLHAWQNLGYAWEIVYLNSMFAHPTPQSRDRMYFVAWKKGNRAPNLRIEPLALCPTCERDVASVQSWKKPAKRYGKYRQQYTYCCPTCAKEVLPYHYAAASAIDWLWPTQRIGDRKTPLKEKTMQRIAYGLQKFARDPFTVQVNKTTNRVRTLLSEAFPTQTGDNGLAMVLPFLLGLNHPRPRLTAVFDQPFPTQTSYDERGLAIPPGFVLQTSHSACEHASYITSAHDSPWPTQTTRQDLALVTPFLLDHVGEYRPRAITDPLSTVVAGGNHQSIVLPPAWLMSYYRHGQMVSVEAPTPTVTTLERHALVTVENQRAPVRVEDCGFRMLEPHEIQAAMAFPAEYVVTGTRREQVRQLGNAVTPPVMRLLMERCLASLA